MYTSMTPDIMTTPSRQEKAKAQSEEVEKFFLEWQEMSPAEKMRAEYLASHNLSEEDLEAMDKDTRAKIEDEIKEYTKQRLTGTLDPSGAEQSPASMLASQLARSGLES